MSPVGEQEETMAVEHKEYGRVRVFTAKSLEAFAQLENWTVPLERLQLDLRMSSGGEGFLQEDGGVDSDQDVDLDWKADDGLEKLQVKIQCCGSRSINSEVLFRIRILPIHQRIEENLRKSSIFIIFNYLLPSWIIKFFSLHRSGYVSQDRLRVEQEI